MTDDISKQLVILIHGIRDIGRWQSEIQASLEDAGFTVELANYDRMNLIKFLLPSQYFRRKAIDLVWTQIQHAVFLHPRRKVCFIAHSFGTYVIANILQREFAFAADRVIFCGSIVRFRFPFEQISSRYTSPVLNEVGTSDPWPALAESVTLGYGSAGTYGFRRPGTRDRYHNGAGHSHFLTAKFCKTYWIPFLTDGKVISGDLPAASPPMWVRLITIFKLKYISAFAIVAILLTVAVYEPSELLNGENAKLQDGFTRADASSFNFQSARIGDWYDPAGDILASNSHASPPRDAAVSFFLPFNSPPYPDQGNACAGIALAKSTNFASLADCEVEVIYQHHWFKPEIGAVYCVRARDGKSFGKLRVTGLDTDRIQFDWTLRHKTQHFGKLGALLRSIVHTWCRH